MASDDVNRKLEVQFQPRGGLQRVYQPQKADARGVKRHSCPDCHFCQGCSETRCQACRHVKRLDTGREGASSKLSLTEQIALYERINTASNKRRSQP